MRETEPSLNTSWVMYSLTGVCLNQLVSRKLGGLSDGAGMRFTRPDEPQDALPINLRIGVSGV